MAHNTSVLLRIAIPESAGPFPSGRPAVNVALFPLGMQGGGEDPSLRGVGGFGYPVGGGITLDPRCKPTSSFAVASSNSGVYMDAIGGAATGIAELDPGEFVAVASSFSPQEVNFVLTVFSSPGLQEVCRLA